MIRNFLFLATTILSLSAFAEPIGPFEKNGFSVVGSEYWPYGPNGEISYPDDILWGFMGEENDHGRPTPARQVAQDCARIAWNELNVFLDSPPADFVKLKSLGATVKFFLWTDDYSQSKPEVKRSESEMWHWNRGKKNYGSGYWKWESNLAQDGSCNTPKMDQILKDLHSILNTVETSGLEP